MPDPMDQRAIRRSRNLSETCVAGFSFRATKLHFYEFVILQGAFRLGDDRRGYTGLADEKHGVQRVPQTS